MERNLAQEKNNKAVFIEFKDIMNKQGMGEQARNFEEALQQIRKMQMQINSMGTELNKVREQLAAVQNAQPSIINNGVIYINDIPRLQKNNVELKKQLSLTENKMLDTAKQAIKEFKEKGKEGLSKVLQKGISGIQSMLKKNREKMVDTLADCQNTVNRIDSIGNELKQAGTSISNVGRLIRGKDALQASQEQEGVGLTRAINKPIKKVMSVVQKQIDNVDKLYDKLDKMAKDLNVEKSQENVKSEDNVKSEENIKSKENVKEGSPQEERGSVKDKLEKNKALMNKLEKSTPEKKEPELNREESR